MNYRGRWTFGLLLTVSLVGCDSLRANDMSTEKAVYAPGEKIVVNYSGFPGNSQDWITVLPAHRPDHEYDQWFYTRAQKKGSLVFNGLPAGDYQVRGYYNWPAGSYKVERRYPFKVAGAAPASSPTSAQLRLTGDKKDYAPGESIQVEFSAPATYASNAWVGIIPSHVAHGSESVNDQYDLSYQYLQNRTAGMLSFTAPSQMGNFDLRMHDTDNSGSEVASVSFTVAGPKSTAAPGLRLAGGATSFKPGQAIQVEFTAPSSYASNAWVGIIPSHVAHGSESVNDQHDLTYQYLQNRVSGTLTFHAPNQPGSFDLRMHDTDSNGSEVASVSFIIAL